MFFDGYQGQQLPRKSLSVDSETLVFTSQRGLTQLWCTLIEIDHLGDWSPEKDCC